MESTVPADGAVDTMAAFQENMRRLLREGTCSDVTLQVGGGNGGEVEQSVTLIRAHSNVLCAHSSVFMLELASTWKERVAAAASGIATVADIKVAYSVAATKAALDFCYAGAIQIPAGDVVEVLDLARHYKISVLADAAAEMIKEQMSVTNVCIFYATAVRFNHDQLCDECFAFCEEHLHAVIAEPSFNSLPAVVMAKLIASDNANANEISIFEALVAWGKANYGEDDSSMEPEREAEPLTPLRPNFSPAAAPELVPGGGAVAALRKRPLSESLAPLFDHIRFPLIAGKDIATSVEPTGLVGDPLLFEAYRYHASGVAKEDCPRFKPRRAGAGNTTEAVLLNTGGEGMAANQTQPDHMSAWELSLGGGGPYMHENAAVAANTKEALLDDSFETGVACNAPAEIVATFPVPTQVSSILVASYHADPAVWGPTNGTGASLEISNDGATWVPLKITLGGNFGTMADDILTIPPNLAAKAWRLTHTSFMGLSKLVFKGPAPESKAEA